MTFYVGQLHVIHECHHDDHMMILRSLVLGLEYIEVSTDSFCEILEMEMTSLQIMAMVSSKVTTVEQLRLQEGQVEPQENVKTHNFFAQWLIQCQCQKHNLKNFAECCSNFPPQSWIHHLVSNEAMTTKIANGEEVRNTIVRNLKNVSILTFNSMVRHNLP